MNLFHLTPLRRRPASSDSNHTLHKHYTHTHTHREEYEIARCIKKSKRDKIDKVYEKERNSVVKAAIATF